MDSASKLFKGDEMLEKPFSKVSNNVLLFLCNLFIIFETKL